MTDLSGCVRLWVRASVMVAAAAVIMGARRVTVTGDSMRPALLPGDRLLIVPRRHPRPGDVVALPDPRAKGRLLVKRVKAVDIAGGTVIVAGDNPSASTDSRVFGPVALRSVVGRAVYRYAPAGREGTVRADLPVDPSARPPGGTICRDG